MNKSIIAIVVLVGIALAGTAAIWWRSRSHNQTDKGEAVTLIPNMLKNSPVHGLAKILIANWNEFSRNATCWGIAYFSGVFGSAFCSALAALILKLSYFKDSPDLRTDLAAASATVAALLVTLSTVGDFRRKWQACRVAEVGVQNLAYDLLSQGPRANAKAILEHLTIINTAYNQAIVGSNQAQSRDLKKAAP